MWRTGIVLTLILAGCEPSVDVASEDYIALADERSYFSDAFRKPESASTLAQGMVAAAFGQDEEAHKLLTEAIADAKGEGWRDVLDTLSEVAMRQGDFSAAETAIRTMLDEFHREMTPEETLSLEQAYSVAVALSGQPVQTVEAACDEVIPTFRDKAGLQRLNFSSNGVAEEAIIDTGANLSVMQRSVAEAAGLKILKTPVAVRSMSQDSVEGHIGIADEFRIGSFTLKNVVFLIFEDEDLSFPQANFFIPAIVGFPVLRAMDEVTFSEDSLTCAPSTESFDLANANLALEGYTMVVEAYIDGELVPLEFDTGASRSQLSDRVYERVPALKDSAEAVEASLGGAGGMVTREIERLPSIKLSAAGREVTLKGVDVDGMSEGPDSFGRIGVDFFGGEPYSINFVTMRVE